MESGTEPENSCCYKKYSYCSINYGCMSFVNICYVKYSNLIWFDNICYENVDAVDTLILILYLPNSMNTFWCSSNLSQFPNLYQRNLLGICSIYAAYV